MKTPLQYLASGIFNILFICWTAFMLVFLAFFTPLPVKSFRRIVAKWSNGIIFLLRIVDIKMVIRGRENLPDRPVLYATKHQSVWDTMFFLWFHSDNVYVMKSELLRIPFWGWYMRKCGHVVIDREGGAGALRSMISLTQRYLEEGRSVVIFPEGTRVEAGKSREYHPGVAALYKQIGMPVIPVALNSGLFWPRREFLKKSGTVIIEFLPQITENLDRKTFMAKLENSIETKTRKLEIEGGFVSVEGPPATVGN